MNKDDYQEQYKKDTEEMHRLDDEWKEVYENIHFPSYQDQEFIDRETEKGGRYEWK